MNKSKKKNNESTALLLGLIAIAGVGGFAVYRRSQDGAPVGVPAVDTSTPAASQPFGTSAGMTFSGIPLVGNPSTGSLFTTSGYLTSQFFKTILPTSGGNNTISTGSDVNNAGSHDVGGSYAAKLGYLPLVP